MHRHLTTLMVSDLRGSTIIRKIHGCHGIVIVRSAEQHITVPKVSLTTLWNLGCRKGKFPSCHPQALHLGIRRQKLMPEMLKKPFECRPLEREALPEDKVLHGVGRYDHGIVPLGIRWKKILPKDLDIDLRSKENVLSTGE